MIWAMHALAFALLMGRTGVSQMDVTINPTGRKFPGMTTVDLKCAVVDFQMGIDPNQKYMTAAQVAEKVAAMVEEVRRREAGLSKTLHEVFGR